VKLTLTERHINPTALTRNETGNPIPAPSVLRVMNKFKHIRTSLSLVVAAVLLSTACSPGNTPEAAAETEIEATEIQGEWVATTPSGLQVTLRPTESPVSVGMVMFHVEFGSEPPDASLLSFDLISPDMPMMGVRRFPLKPQEDGFMVMADIPMTGLWNAYVNVGAGTEAAEFAFDVQAAPGGAGHEHN
jgi:hypothetical protein